MGARGLDGEPGLPGSSGPRGLPVSVQCACARVHTLMGNLEKALPFEIVISRPGKVHEIFFILKVLEKSWKIVIFIC